MPSDEPHVVTVGQHTYGYWRAQCLTCGSIQNWRTQIDAEWWAGRHEENEHADR